MKKVINNPHTLYVIMQKIYQRELLVNPKRSNYFWIVSLAKDYRLLDLVAMDQKKVESGKITMNEVLRFTRLIDASYIVVVHTAIAEQWELPDWTQKLKDRIKKAADGNETPLMEWMLISRRKYLSLRMENKL